MLAAGCIFTSAGFVNSLIYTLTRNLVSLPPVFEVVSPRRLTRNLPSISSSFARSSIFEQDLRSTMNTFKNAESEENSITLHTTDDRSIEFEKSPRDSNERRIEEIYNIYP